MSKLSEYLSNPPKYQDDTIAALKVFKKNFRAWRPGDPLTFEQAQGLRLTGMQELVGWMAKAEGMVPPEVDARFITQDGHSWESYYDRNANKITMIGKLSIITLLHEFAHALLGRDEFEAQRWSICLFKTVYPKAFERLFPHETEQGVFMAARPEGDYHATV